MAEPIKDLPPPPHAGTHGDIWQTLGRFQLIGQAYDLIRAALPAFDHSIQVSVTGGPDADIRRIWYLCVSAVYGRFRNRVRTAAVPISMDVTWDISGKAVMMELAYHANALTNGFSVDNPSSWADDPGSCGAAFLARGPEQLTVGGEWNTLFNPLNARIARVRPPGRGERPLWVAKITHTGCIGTGGDDGVVAKYAVATRDSDNRKIRVLSELPIGGLAKIPGMGRVINVLEAKEYAYKIHFPTVSGGLIGPTSAVTGGESLPRLPDHGRVITTNESRDPRVQPPKPPTDGSTRCSLLALVAAELQTPCFLPQAPPCTKNPAGGSGLFVQRPDDPTSAEPVDMADLWSQRTRFDGTWPLAVEQGPDGYPLGSTQDVNYGG